jgi:cell division protein FtsQ
VALRRTVLLAAVAALVTTGWLTLRDSGLVAVRTVTVTGVSSSEGAEVRRVLTAAAKRMTTLHVREDELRAAVRRFSSVEGVDAQTDFPHGLAIEVTERQPVAEVEFAGQRVPVGAGGRLMRGVRPSRPLPALSANRLAPGGRLTDPKALDAVALLAAAPEILRQRVARVWTGPKGLTVGVRQGPQLYFGTRRASTRSGSPPRACSPSRPPPGPSTSTSGCPSGSPPAASGLTLKFNLRKA